MAESKKNKRNDYFESFVWKPRPASCLKADGSRDYEKLNALIKQAQEWIHEAQMLVFEQYSGTWQSMCHQSNEVMYRLAMDYEDFQQEAFYSYLKALKKLDSSKPENLKQYFITYFANRIMDLLRNIEKQVVGHGGLNKEKNEDGSRKFSVTLCSIYEKDKTGNPKYDISTTIEQEYLLSDYYPRISRLLTAREMQVVIDCYIDKIPLKQVAKKYKLSYGRIRNILSEVRKKLQRLKKQ